MAFPKNSMNFDCENKDQLAEFVGAQILNSPNDYPWTMTITQGRSGDFSVRTVTGISSDVYDEATVATFFSDTQVNT